MARIRTYDDGASRRVDSGKGAKIGARTTFLGKSVDPLPEQVVYLSDLLYPNSIRID